jgi:hypothetical protein
MQCKCRLAAGDNVEGNVKFDLRMLSKKESSTPPHNMMSIDEKTS